MKKLLLIMILLLAGCVQKKTICTYEINNNEQNYTASIKYKIYHHKGYVNKVKIDEKYLSNDTKVVKYYDKYLNMTYVQLNENYGGVNYKKQNINKGIRYKTTIVFDKENVKKMIKDNYFDDDYIKGNKLPLKVLTTMYEKKGSKCK